MECLLSSHTSFLLPLLKVSSPAGDHSPLLEQHRGARRFGLRPVLWLEGRPPSRCSAAGSTWGSAVPSRAPEGEGSPCPSFPRDRGARVEAGDSRTPPTPSRPHSAMGCGGDARPGQRLWTGPTDAPPPARPCPVSPGREVRPPTSRSQSREQ